MSLARSSIADSSVVTLLLSIRFINAAVLRTFFQPDEYYQALEPAWNLVPKGHGAWITWEWTQHLRSAAHPALFSAAYYIANATAKLFTRQDLQQNVLLFAPKIVQAVVAALGDFYTWKLSQKVYGASQLASITLCLTIFNPWQWFCSTRTFSNGLENTLTVAALYYWPSQWNTAAKTPQGEKSGQSSSSPRSVVEFYSKETASSLRLSLLLAAAATVLRPTNLLIWIVLALMTLFQCSDLVTKPISSKGLSRAKDDNFRSRFIELAKQGLYSGVAILALSAVVDRAFYGTWTLPALNFLYFNVVQSLAVFYGNNDWHYYLSQGYPLLLTTALPFTLVGLYQIFTNSPHIPLRTPITQRSLKQLATICLALPAALSVLSHKEVRFIYPLLGPLQVIATAPVQAFFQPVYSSASGASTPRHQSKLLRSLTLAILLLINIVIASYTSLIHNSGIIALPDYFRNEFLTYYTPSTIESSSTPSPPSQNMTIGILMPCHSLPWRSHLLNPPSTSTAGIQAWALTCEPPLHLTNPSEKASYLDEADIFYANPSRWLRKNMSRRRPTDYKHATTSLPPPTTSSPSSQRNKKLWSTPPPSPDTPDFSTRPGIDITDLLPYLRTAPNRPSIMSILSNGPIRRPWPHYIAFFAQLEPAVAQALHGSGYVECWRVFNSHWHDDRRRTGDVVVWCLFPERATGYPVDGT